MAWWAWMGICGGTLALFALRVPLAARQTQPIEDAAGVAISMMALGVATWLAPILLATWSRTLIAAASIVPLLVIANQLCALPAGHAIGPVVLTLAWLIALHMATAFRPLQAALAMLATLGPAAWYLAQDFAPTPFHLDSPWAGISPPLGAAAIFSHPGLPTAPFAGPIVLILGCLAMRLTLRLRQRRAPSKA